MAEELEEAVTFLERVKAVFPNVTSLLNTTQVLALDTDLAVPYSDQKTANEDFVKLTEAYFVTKHNVDMTKNALRLALMDPHTSGKTVDVEEQERTVQCLKKVILYSLTLSLVLTSFNATLCMRAGVIVYSVPPKDAPRTLFTDE